MTAQQFHLVSRWRLRAPLSRTWAALNAVDDWPKWWRAVERVQLLQQGDAQGLGAVRKLTWRTALPYKLSFDICMTRISPMSIIEGQASGELTGVGLWTLEPDGADTHVRYDWTVDVTKPWMRALAPVLRPMFEWNHNIVMSWGNEGLARHLAEAPEVLRSA